MHKIIPGPQRPVVKCSMETS